MKIKNWTHFQEKVHSKETKNKKSQPLLDLNSNLFYPFYLNTHQHFDLLCIKCSVKPLSVIIKVTRNIRVYTNKTCNT